MDEETEHFRKITETRAEKYRRLAALSAWARLLVLSEEVERGGR